MTAPVSSAPAVKAALVTLILSVMDQDPTTGDPIVGVWYTDVGANFPDDNVLVGKIAQSSQPARMMGSGGMFWMNEKYSIEVEISCHRGGVHAQPAEERVWHLAAVIGTALRADPSIGGLVLVAWPASIEVESEWIDDPGGWQAIGTMHIDIENPL